jgi:hypothetical protein
VLNNGASDVTVRGLTITNTRDSAVRINAGARHTIANNTITNFDCDGGGNEGGLAGVAVWQSGSGHQVLDNVITGQAARRGFGVWFKSTNTQPSGGGHTISRNQIRNVYDGIGGETEDHARGGFDRDTLIEANQISDCDDDGISVEGGTQNVRVRNNTITRCAIGIANAPNLTGPVYFENNTITNAVPGYYGNTACFKVGNNGRGVAYFTGNVCTIDGDGWSQTNAGMNPVISRRNEIRVTRYVMEMNSISSGVSETAFSWDEDIMCTTDPDRFWEYLTGRYDSMADVQARTRHETNGVQC